VTHSGTVALAFTLLVALSGLAGCGDDGAQILDTDAVEAQVRAAAEDAGSVVQDVVCPDERDEEEGDEFACDIQMGADQSGSVDVTQTGDGEVTFELPDALQEPAR
jgi:predicted small lipoprotein YifL